MATAAELREAIGAALPGLRAAIEGAGEAWERVPPPSAAAPAGAESGESGEEDWSPREATEHVVRADYSFAGAIAAAIGGEVPERPELALASPAEALAALDRSAAALDAAVAPLTDDQLEASTRYERPVQWVAELAANHRREHAQQIGAAG
jgi:hypothetical protein